MVKVLHLEGIKLNLQLILDKLQEKECLAKNLYFIRKNKIGYSSFSPEIDKKLWNVLLVDASKYIANFLQFEQVQYSPIGYRDGTLEVCDIDYASDYFDMMACLENGEIEDIEENVEKLTCYCIEVEDDEGNNIKLFRRMTKFKKLYSKGCIAMFRGNQLNKLDGKMIGLDGDVDLIVYNNEEIAILNHVGLERIFRMNDHFYEKAKEALDNIRNTGRIVNIDLFEEDCLNNARYQKILTKMLNEGTNIEASFEYMDNIMNTIALFELDIEIKEGMIVYEDKSQIMDILRIARDSYYRSLIQEEKGIDDKIVNR